MKWSLIPTLFLFFLSACGNSQPANNERVKYEVEKSEEEWKAQLSELEYEVIRKEGTERAFSGKYVDWKKKGTFVCKACDYPLFNSKTKFISGTGWPSFYDIIDGHVLEKADNKYGWDRTEVECARCGGHLGHVFNDGPQPTGLRYCINSVSLDFKED